MDPIQAATFSAYAPISRFAEPATAMREQSEDTAFSVEQAVEDTGLGAGIGVDAAVARQAAAQETAPSEASANGASRDDTRSPDDGGKGRVIDLLA